MPVFRRKWWLDKISDINEEENKKNMLPAVMTQPSRSRVTRARDVGR